MNTDTKNALIAEWAAICDKLNAHLPCRSASDAEAVAILIRDRIDSSTAVPKPKIYWDRQVCIDNDYDDERCFNALLFGGKLAFYPSDDVEEHPGVEIKYKQ